jgi:ankyrin repeat protein
LKPEQADLIKAWIDQGADWPEELAGERSSSAADLLVGRMLNVLRNGDRHEFNRMLREKPEVVNRKGQGGSTPIMYAAMYGDAEAVRRLLERGADPNTPNEGGATALMYAVSDLEKTRILLEHRADPNARSGEGRTPLLIAAGRTGSTPSVKMLLDRGANPSVQGSDGRTALAIATGAGDETALELLLDRGAEKKPLPLALALQVGCSHCFEILLKFADHNDLNTALITAARLGDSHMIRTLLTRGADVGPNLLPAIALSLEPLPVDMIQGLIDRGADINAKTAAGGTVLDLAKSQGHTALVDVLTKAGAKEERISDQPILIAKPASSARAALDRSIPLLQRTDVAFIEKAGCVSCHNNSLTAMTMAAARNSRIHLDENIARAQLKATAFYLDANRERALQGVGVPGGSDTAGYILLGMAAEKYPRDAITDIWAEHLKNYQLPDGRWRCLSLRPPLEASDFQTTATALRAIQVYGPQSKRAKNEKAVRLGARWLEGARPKSNEDRVFQLLGLHWAGGNREVIQKLARELLALQRSDGGWAQLPAIQSDAYASGQALVALRESRSLAVASSAYQRGLQFLLNSQLEDGSWHVRTRTLPIQPHFDSDFPHGRDQFISAAATNWAAMALAAVVR